MAVSTTIRCLFISLSLVCADALAFAQQAAAQQAAAQQAGTPASRCEGTLCDWYYGSATNAPQGAATNLPAGATPVTVPNGVIGRLFGGGTNQATGGAATTSARPFVAVDGGGILSDHKPKRCSGTLCDAYYGSAAPEEDEPTAQQASAAPMAASVSAAAPAEPEAPRRIIEHEKPVCGTAGADPWKCFR